MPRIGLSSWSLTRASSLLSLLPVNPGLGSWQLPTRSGRTQWPHAKFIAYNIAVGGDIKYFCGVFGLGIPHGCWQRHTYPDILSPCSKARWRGGLARRRVHAAAERQGWMLVCAKSQVLWQGAGYLCMIHLEPGFYSTVRSICLGSVLCCFCSVKNPKALAGCPFEQALSPSRTLPLGPQQLTM